MKSKTPFFMDAEISEKHLESYSTEIQEWVRTHTDKMFARKVLPFKELDEDVDVDIVTKYDRTGKGAIIATKGHVPSGSGSKATDVPYSVYQILDGFKIHQRDLKLDPSKKARDLKICMSNIHYREDYFTIHGRSDLGVTGLVGAAQANPNGKIVAAGAAGNDVNNNGAWDGSDASEDPHMDIVEAVARCDKPPKFLVGHRNDLLYLDYLDAQRQPYWKTISSLFGVNDKSFIQTTNIFTRGKVYLMAYDEEAAELAVQENPTPYFLPMQSGQKWPVEVAEWVVPEFHQNDNFVEIDIT